MSEEWGTPLTVERATAVTFTAGRGLPSFNSLNEDPRFEWFQELLEDEDAVWIDAAGDERSVVESIEELQDRDPEGFGAGDRVGGWPFFAQHPTTSRYPHRPSDLLIQLDSDAGGFTSWGDGGAGQLFGNPAEVAVGNLSSVWWDWACY